MKRMLAGLVAVLALAGCTVAPETDDQRFERLLEERIGMDMNEQEMELARDFAAAACLAAGVGIPFDTSHENPEVAVIMEVTAEIGMAVYCPNTKEMEK